MDYYVSWTHSDPIYQQHLADIRVLVSPPNVSLTWRPAAWPAMPIGVILDSGAYQYHRARRHPEPAVVLSRQLQIAADLRIPTGICHLDVPMLGTRDPTELNRRVEQNLANACWLIEAAQEVNLPKHVSLIGVIQGYSVDLVYASARALADLGFTSFALGSLARMVANSRDQLLRRVEAALEAVGENLHILGVSSAALLADLKRIGVQSADSGAPIHEAWRGGIFYSRPFRRYKIASPHFTEWRRSYSFAEVLSAPLPCDCPVCQEDSQRLLVSDGKAFVNLRAIHNCYHLLQELGALSQ